MNESDGYNVVWSSLLIEIVCFSHYYSWASLEFWDQEVNCVEQEIFFVLKCYYYVGILPQ
jgi:hypothetical protein